MSVVEVMPSGSSTRVRTSRAHGEPVACSAATAAAVGKASCSANAARKPSAGARYLSRRSTSARPYPNASNSSPACAGSPLRIASKSRSVTWSLTQGSQRSKPDQYSRTGASQASLPSPTSDASIALVNPSETTPSWNTVPRSTGSYPPARRTPKQRTYTAVSPATMATAAPGTPLRATIA